jgi:hypothetical protein
MTFYISLGYNCSIAYQIKKYFPNQKRLPFDWIKCKKFDIIVSSIINCFQNNSLNYLFENLEFVKDSNKHSDFENKYTGKSSIFKNNFFEFFHDFFLDNSNFEEQYQIVKQKYLRRFSRLFDLLNSNNHIHFIYLLELNIFDIISLEKLFDFLLKNNILFTFTLLTPKKINFEHSLFNQIIINKSYPYDWTYSHLNWNEIFLINNYRSFISNDFNIPLHKEICNQKLIELYDKILEWKNNNNYDWISVKIWLGEDRNMIKIVGKEKPRELLNENDVFYFQEEEREKYKESVCLSKESFILQKYDKFSFPLSSDGFTQSNIKISILLYKYVKKLVDQILFNKNLFDNKIIIYGRNSLHIGSFIEQMYKAYIPCQICLSDSKKYFQINNIEEDFINLFDENMFKNDVDRENNLVIISPGRKGFNKYIKNIQSKFIIYISCNQKSLSFDLNLIKYKILDENIFNIFPGTEYIEKVLLLEKI